MVDWTQVFLAAITMIGTVLSAVFSARAQLHSKSAATSADVAVQASLRPPSAARPTEWASLQPPGGDS